MNNVFVGVVTILLLIGGVLQFNGALEFEPGPADVLTTSESTDTTAKVARVIDGDTLDLTSGERLRLLGIDSPERDECYYEEARSELVALVTGETLRLVRDTSETDKYDRVLRYVYFSTMSGADTGEPATAQEEVFVNEVLVRAGVATTLSIPPDTRYRAQLRAAEAEARAAGRGLWGACE